MLLNKRTLALIQVHLAVFLFGFSALFGKILSLTPITIVFYRVVIATLTLGTIIFLLKQKLKLISKRDYFFMFILGSIFSIHWITFFKSVQVSTVAIGVLTFSTYPIFVTFLEPYFFKEKIRQKDIISAALAFSGIVLVIPSFELSNNITQGAFWGVISGLTGAFLTIFNKMLVKKYSGIQLAFYQCLFASILLFPFVFSSSPALKSNDFFLLILLGVIFTALSHVLYINSVLHIKAQLASIITCLEPVYGIVFAIILLKETLGIRTIVGGAIILGSIIFATLKSRNKTKISNILN